MMGWLAERLRFWEERRNYAEAKEAEAARRALVTHLAKENVQLAMFTVAADDECERCALICDDIAEDCKIFADHSAVLSALRCAAAIRKGKG